MIFNCAIGPVVRWSVAVTDENAIADRGGDEGFGGGDGVFHALALGEFGGDAGGIGTAGAVGAHGVDALCGKLHDFTILCEQNVFSVSGFKTMAAFDDDVFHAHGLDFLRSSQKIVGVLDGHAADDFCFRHVWCEHGGQRQDLTHEGGGGFIFHERSAAFGDHHWIDDDGNFRMLPELSGDGAHDLCVRQHAGFEGANLKIAEDGAHLLVHKFHRDFVDALHAEGVLRCHSDDDGGAENAAFLEGFQIGLNAGAATAVTACDGERLRDRFCLISHLESSLVVFETVEQTARLERFQEQRAGCCTDEGGEEEAWHVAKDRHFCAEKWQRHQSSQHGAEDTGAKHFPDSGSSEIWKTTIDKPCQQRADHTAGKCHDRTGADEVADDRCDKCTADGVPRSQRDGCEHVHKMLHRRCFCKADRDDDERTADDAQSDEKPGEHELFGVVHSEISSYNKICRRFIVCLLSTLHSSEQALKCPWYNNCRTVGVSS